MQSPGGIRSLGYGTMMIQRRNKIDRMNIQRVKPFEEDLDNK